MILSRRNISRIGVGAFILLLVALAGVRYAAAQEIPITTKSPEALKIFLEARVKTENVHTEEAHKLYAQAVAKDPDFALAHLYMANTASDTKIFMEELKKAIALAPNASKGEQLLISAQQAAAMENNAIKSHQIYQQLVELYPNDKRAHIFLGNSYVGREERDKGIAEFEKAMALDKTYTVPYYRLAYNYFYKNDLAKAEQYFKAYRELAPQEPNPYDCLGDLYMKMGRFDDAIGQYQQAVKLDPHFSMSQAKIGSCHYLTGRYEEGRQAVEKAKAMELDPAYKLGDEVAIARSYIYAGDYRKALEGEDKVIRMAPETGQPEAVFGLNLIKAVIHCELKEYDKAAQCLAEGLKSAENPALPPAARENFKVGAGFWEAFVAAQAKDIAKAEAKLAEIRAAMAKIKQPLFPKYADWMAGFIMMAKGDYAGADAMFTKLAIEDDPFFMYYQAMAKEKAGDAAGAKKLYTKVANWNEDGDYYALVRDKAKAKI